MWKKKWYKQIRWYRSTVIALLISTTLILMISYMQYNKIWGHMVILNRQNKAISLQIKGVQILY